MNAYLFFVSLGLAIVLYLSFLLLRKNKFSLSNTFWLLSLGLLILIFFSKALGALGYYLFANEINLAPTSVMGLFIFLVFFAQRWAQKNKEVGRKLLSLWSYLLPLSQSVGRIGCYFAGCCFTKNPYDFSWPLLEASLNLFLALFLFIIRKEIAPLKAFRIYLVSSLILRFLLEFLRGDFIRGFIGPLSLPQWTCLALFCWVFLDSLLDKYHNKAHEIRSRRIRK